MPFKNVRTYHSDGISNLLEINLREWLCDGFMRIGSLIPPRHTPTELFPDASRQVWSNPDVQNWASRRFDGDNIIYTPATILVDGVTEPRENVTINYAKGQVTFKRALLPGEQVVKARHYTNSIDIFNVLELNRRPTIRLGAETNIENDDG